jgi:hypothetical protein
VSPRGLARLAFAVVAFSVVAAVPAAASAAPADAKRRPCVRAVITGKTVCLRLHQRCTVRLRSQYLRAGLDCRRGRLRRASPAAVRRGEPVLLDRRGHVDRRTALEAFDTALAPLPGVTPRRGAVGEIRDATWLVKAVADQRARLTLSQRAVLDRVLDAGPTATVAAIGAAEQQEWTTLAAEARGRLAAHGYAIAHPIALSFPESNIEPQSGRTVVGYAWPAWMDDTNGEPGTCTVWITPKGRTSTLAERRNTIAHELFHCAQFEQYASQEEWSREPQWVVEGGAEWAGTTIAQEWNGTDTPDAFWNGWLFAPDVDLGQRLYSAIGFFALMGQSGIDVFQRMHGILTAGASGGDGSAFAVATAGAPPGFYDIWGPGYLRDASIGPTWELKGAGLPASPQPHATIANGTSLTLSTADRAAMGLRLDLQADVVTLVPVVRHGLMRGPDGQVPLQGTTYCTLPGGCACEGESLDATPFPKGKGLPVGWFAGYITVEGRSVADECSKRRKDTGGDGGDGRGPGIMVFSKARGGEATIVATFRSGSCSVSGGVFTATSSDSGYRLTATIRRFDRFRDYPLRYRSADPSFVVTGPGGPYRNAYFPGGTPPPAGGAITFPDGRARMGLGFIDAFNAAASRDIALAGQMACRWPRRR